MANHAERAQRWADRATGKTDKPAHERGNANVFERDGKVYSYGTHFEMGRYVKPAPRSGVAPFFLLNGDSYSVTTTRHQSHVRDAVRKTGAPSAIIPHTAMTRAGIVLDSIVPVDVLPETHETIPHTVTVPGLADLAARAAEGAFGWDRSGGDADKERGTFTLSAERKLTHEGATYTVRALKRGYDHTVQGPRDCGACDGTGRIPTAYNADADGKTACGNPACNDGKVTSYGAWVDYSPARVSFYRNGGGLAKLPHPDTFTYDSYRHFLGGVVFHAEVQETVYRTCENHGATDGGHWCNVCGDYVTESHTATPGPHRYRDTVKRRAWFVSGWDENETRPLYFLAELPKGARAKTYAEALAALAPSEVAIAIGLGLEVKRQGDIFAVPCVREDGPPAIAARYAERGAAIPLDGTARHVATELVTCADGRHERVYARGTLRHIGGDHRAVKLGNVWHRMYRNTVPMPHVQGDRQNVREVRAWTIAGRVD